MSKPRSIKTRGMLRARSEIHLIGGQRPYLFISKLGLDEGGFIEDRDIKRLKKWCEKCLEGMKK